MLKILSKVAETAVKLPIALTADVITLGGAMTERKQPYTKGVCEDLMDAVTEKSKDRE